MDAIEIAESNPALAEFKRRDLGIRDMATRFMPLKINGLKDRDGFNAVHTARMEVKGVRVGIEKTRKELKAAVLEYGRAVDSEAGRLTGLIEPIETHLQSEEDAITNEKARIAAAIEETRQALVRVRFESFQGLGQPTPFGLGDMTEEAYQVALTTAKSLKAQADAVAAREAQRLADEREAARLERVALDRVRAEQDAIRKEQEAKAAELKAHQERIAAQEAEQRRAAELEEARKVAAERAVRETEARLTAEAEAKRIAAIQQQQAEEEQRKADAIAHQKALDEMPVKAKIIALAAQVDSMAMSWDVGGHPVMLKISKIITKAAADIRKLSNGPLE